MRRLARFTWQFGLSVVVLVQVASAQTATTGTAGTTFGSGITENTFGISGFGAGAQNSVIQNAFSGAAIGGQTTNPALNSFARGVGGGFGAGFGGFGGGFGGGGAGQTQENQTPIPFTLKLGFKPRLRSPAEVSQLLSSRLTRLPMPAKFAGMRVSIEGTTAVVSGSVPTKEDAQVAEQLMLLEPGVNDVQNDLTWTRDNDWDGPEEVTPR